VNPDIASIPLRDIHLPETVSWWPLAPGWWIMLGFLVLVIVVVFFLRLARERQLLGKQSLQEFTQLVNQFQQDRDAKLLLSELSRLLRRVSITRYENQDSAALVGQEWLRFLDQALANHKNEQALSFDSELGEYLVTAQYKKSVSVDEKKLDQLLVLSKAWLQVVSNNSRAGKNHFAEGDS